MAEMPDFIRDAIKAQGKYAPEEIEEKLDALEPEALLGVVEPEPLVEEAPEIEDQEVLFDAAAGEAARDEAMARVDAAAEPEWKDQAWAAIVKLAGMGEDFTSDEVWEIVGFYPPERRALGPLISRAVQSGMCFDSGTTRKSNRPENHRRPIAIWRVAQ